MTLGLGGYHADGIMAELFIMFAVFFVFINHGNATENNHLVRSIDRV